MMEKFSYRFLLLLLVSLPGCTLTGGHSPPSRFYVLPAPKTAAAPLPLQRTIALLPVQLPRYLDRPQIVTFAADGRVTLAEFHRWAEPLAAGFQRILASSLAQHLPRSHIVVLPAPRIRTDWQIAVRVNDFQVSAAHCQLIADWRLIEAGRTRTWQRKTIRIPLPDQRYATIVGTMSRAIATLAAHIATELGRATSGNRAAAPDPGPPGTIPAP